MKLSEYLEKHMVNKVKFCRRVGIAPHALYRILRGNDTRLSIAMDIVKESNGEVGFNEIIDPDRLKTIKEERRKNKRRKKC